MVFIIQISNGSLNQCVKKLMGNLKRLFTFSLSLEHHKYFQVTCWYPFSIYGKAGGQIGPRFIMAIAMVSGRIEVGMERDYSCTFWAFVLVHTPQTHPPQFSALPCEKSRLHGPRSKKAFSLYLTASLCCHPHAAHSGFWNSLLPWLSSWCVLLVLLIFFSHFSSVSWVALLPTCFFETLGLPRALSQAAAPTPSVQLVLGRRRSVLMVSLLPGCWAPSPATSSLLISSSAFLRACWASASGCARHGIDQSLSSLLDPLSLTSP